MIDVKYGMKYHFPHTLVHIIDNSGYTGTVPVVYADDPSLFSTLVVGGFPMGEDGKVTKITRSDVARVAYGINNITQADREKYGQVIDYPTALIRQGAPVQLLRVTPEDAQYAFCTIKVHYRWVEDPTNTNDEPKLHVKFTADYTAPTGAVLSNFKNPQKLAQAIFAQNANLQPDANGWTTRAFAVVVSAGRGSIYNNMHMCIDAVSQSKRPANVRYIWSTVDTRTSAVIEEFAASLVNIDNADRTDYTETVNNIIYRREPGASVLKPYINEKVVSEIYNVYIKHYNDELTLNPDKYKNNELAKNAIKVLNVNTFDLIYGKYIYNGGLGTNLPFYQVDAEDIDIPKLDTEWLRYNSVSQADAEGDEPYLVLKNEMIKDSYGVETEGCYTYVGDVFLSDTGSKHLYPKLTFVCAINQYLQAITSIQFDSVYKKSELDQVATATMPPAVPIAEVFEGAVDLTPATPFDPDNPTTKSGRKAGDVVASIVTSANGVTSFKLYEITYSEGTFGTSEYSHEDIIKAIPYTLKNGIENVVAIYKTPQISLIDPLFTTRGAVTGYTVVDVSSGKVYVNNYDIEPIETPADPSTAEYDIETNRIEITKNAVRYGNAPTQTGLTTNQVGNTYDILTFADDLVDSWQLTNAAPNASFAGTGYLENDTVKISTGGTNYVELVVTAVNGSGGVTALAPASDTSKTVSPTKVTGDAIEADVTYTLTTEAPADWASTYTQYYTYNAETKTYVAVPAGEAAPEWEANKYYSKTDNSGIYTLTTEAPANWATTYTQYYTKSGDTYTPVPEAGVGEDPPTWTANTYYSKRGYGLKVTLTDEDWAVLAAKDGAIPREINRYTIYGAIGSLYKIQLDAIDIPNDYYSKDYGENLSSEFGGLGLQNGSAGFFDDPEISDIEFKYRYAALLTKAFKGEIDARILSPVRTPAKFLFDASYNTVVGAAFATLGNHSVAEWINGSVVFTDEEKDEITFNPQIIANLEPADLDVKQAMYELMITRIYDGMPEDKRPIGPGSGLQVHFDSCIADGNTAVLIRNNFDTKFTNPNASWDVGGYVTPSGETYTWIKRLVDNLFTHCKQWTINKPFTNDYSVVNPEEYVSTFPDADSTNWEYRELMWTCGGNAWVPDSNGYIRRMSQRTCKDDDETSDLIWESNMRTLSQLTYLLKNKIEHYLFEYSDDSVLKTLKVECENMFSNWVGNVVDTLTIDFERDINTDGGDIVVCYVNVTFRGLIVRVPIIVNVNRRSS